MNVAASFYERIFFKTEYLRLFKKCTQLPQYVRRIALEAIHKISCDVLQSNTDDRMGVGAVSSSGIFIKKGHGIKICQRNPDYCLVFREELLAIEEALKFCFTESIKTDIWILSDSRSSI
ncbi:uncharacterized protein TNCV_1897931 [Trichonephila clavipes]|uniref:RNase H type-1 domain-containing protein n=1 Tax=Trichonephila clavipes TaxID=2585209 RepID=A0A8X6WG21_TRICX|nr:uncharacterized protein TNCV_1897931 [Trichonephila clavipes]